MANPSSMSPSGGNPLKELMSSPPSLLADISNPLIANTLANATANQPLGSDDDRLSAQLRGALAKALDNAQERKPGNPLAEILAQLNGKTNKLDAILRRNGLTR